MPFQKLINKLLALVEKYHSFNVKYFKLFVTVVMLVLLSMVLFLGWMSTRKITEIVTEDFNQQQLMLAKHAASQIENSLELLKKGNDPFKPLSGNSVFRETCFDK